MGLGDSLAERTDRVDALARAEWPRIEAASLIAVGGYGRRELFPYSDIDLLIVSSRTGLRDLLAPFLRNLWDAGLRVSQSVHSLAECLQVESANVELSVSLLDRRWIAGDRAVFEKLRNPPREQLAPALSRLAYERHAKFGGTIFHLEPNVKESPGGLRDVSMVRWLAALEDTQPSLPSHALLQRLRVALHRAARRDQNTLNFDMQDSCALTFGFESAAGLMRAYYREAGPIFNACLRAIDRAANRRTFISGLRERASDLSNHDFSVRSGRVYFRDPAPGPRLIAQLFAFVAQHGTALAPETEDRVADTPDCVLDWENLRLLLDSPHAGLAVRAMHAAGYLERIFPGLRGIESLVIRDFYHRYTVDEHTLVALQNAVELRTSPKRKPEAIFGELARETPDYPLLLMALLFHDSGKAQRTADHAAASVAIAEHACAALRMDDAERKTILFLIENHLEMSRLMTTRDLRDPAAAAALGSLVGTVERLKMLTVMTYCDIGAVNPAALTPWRATLLWQLYVSTARRLTQELQEHTADEGMPPRYALTHTPEEIAEHHRMELEGRAVRLDRVSGHHRLTVVARDRPFLFADIAGAISGFGMNILRAEAFVNERHAAIETFVFSDPMNALELNPSEAGRMCGVVEDVLAGRKSVSDLLRGRPRPRTRIATPPQVFTDNTVSPYATLIEINAEDRPGLLYDLARYFSEAGCNIETVLIDTEGHRAIDVFYVSRENRRLEDESAALLRAGLIEPA